ncbi:phosphoenolpyruvate synthase regulatory protein [Paenibacillus macerans]|uniref:Putative pyruvate, phosphate dikinase regulatory protein n=1 Tax=Paenibacillus macerans TaxID=44252 RepID=A0A6N8F0T5_PAEMA|nr:pyruvate, water dikinase regulatory protein [Paenibacillus macerans]MED4954040.1 kinase/pyrophosphorylase [Paenibacillus macerans]MUG24172.1 pyruvate, phosphate dikinase/phosphoenolpyruvate synthase regulator [Paenibacillus macerans]OMG46427.1 phosphoenolpyruvate synthase regulatory protein [Paenibacillus macerans]GIP08923.1 phosphoenolpyruvate synthase regulatory protein [Paenibacillus macerans]GJM76569.1 phosphoenolpyruvate synthase regulatory protein [Paenibacillus macerans]
METSHLITICSDSLGDTAEAVVQAVIHQFENQRVKIKRYGNIRHEDELRKLLEEAARHKGFVAYTLVQPELREVIREEAVRLDLRIVDIMGPMMQAFIDTFDDAPRARPGLLHQLNENYFRRIEAIDFTVASDGGRNLEAMFEADIVVMGISRTSKTPLSIFLAHRGKKVVNYPLVPEVGPPPHLLSLPASRLIGLTMEPEHMLKIRSERLKMLGLPLDTQYTSLARIREETDYALALYSRLKCPVIDITDKAIEETAGIIMGYI